MKYLLVISALIILSCNDNKPVSYDAVQKIKEDSATTQRLSEVKGNIIDQRLATVQYSPVKILSTEVFSTDHQWITVQVQNTTGKAIDGIKIGYFFYNNFGELVSEQNTGIYQQTIKPGASTFITWNTEAKGATKAKSFVEEIHFTSDSTWNFKSYMK